MRRRLLTLLTAAALAAGVLTGCQSAEKADKNVSTSSNASEKNADSASRETITITDARGEVKIPSDTQRIVDLSGNSDILSVLGYSVAGTANSDAYDYTKFPSYLEDTLKDAEILGYSMQDTMDIEGILNLDPDLIIISSVQEKMYNQLQKIAPTVMIELAQINWKEDISTFAEIFGREEAAEKWLSAYEAKAQETGKEVRKKLGEDTTCLALLASGGQLFVFDAAGIGSVMYEDMGLKKPAGMPVQENISLPVISYEGLAEIDADYLLVIGTDADTETLRANRVYQAMRAVKEGRVTELPASPYFNMGYSCIGRDLLLDEFSSLLEMQTGEK